MIDLIGKVFVNVNSFFEVVVVLRQEVEQVNNDDN